MIILLIILGFMYSDQYHHEIDTDVWLYTIYNILLRLIKYKKDRHQGINRGSKWLRIVWRCMLLREGRGGQFPYPSVSSWCPRGVMVKAMNCGIVVREFVLQSRYYVHFRANTLGKGMNPLILPPAMGK